MDERDRSIIRQVAFKGAIELVPHDKDTNAKFLVDSVKWLTDQFEAIILGSGSNKP